MSRLRRAWVRFREIVVPSSLPDPPHVVAAEAEMQRRRSERTLRQRLQARQSFDAGARAYALASCFAKRGTSTLPASASPSRPRGARRRRRRRPPPRRMPRRRAPRCARSSRRARGVAQKPSAPRWRSWWRTERLLTATACEPLCWATERRSAMQCWRRGRSARRNRRLATSPVQTPGAAAAAATTRADRSALSSLLPSPCEVCLTSFTHLGNLSLLPAGRLLRTSDASANHGAAGFLHERRNVVESELP